MARAMLLVAGLAVVELLLLCTADAAFVELDNTATCRSALPACETKCKGLDYVFSCSAKADAPRVGCRCTEAAAVVGGPQQSEHFKEGCVHTT
jgi:hypothetical protein